MTAEEIRKKNNWECYGQPFEDPIQVEIAAQLAELNENLQRLITVGTDISGVR